MPVVINQLSQYLYTFSPSIARTADHASPPWFWVLRDYHIHSLPSDSVNFLVLEEWSSHWSKRLAPSASTEVETPLLSEEKPPPLQFPLAPAIWGSSECADHGSQHEHDFHPEGFSDVVFLARLSSIYPFSDIASALRSHKACISTVGKNSYPDISNLSSYVNHKAPHSAGSIRTDRVPQASLNLLLNRAASLLAVLLKEGTPAATLQHYQANFSWMSLPNPEVW